MILNLKRCLGIAGLISVAMLPTASGAACAPLLNHSFPGLQDGKTQSLCQYQGKVILVVNTASFCGYTSQYEGLEKLYADLKGKGLVVVGFPSNDFGEQEPGSSKEIADFCRLTYGVEFPTMGKTVVKGKDAGSQPKWNFHKYLINRDTRQVLAFGSSTTPDDPALIKKIDEFLK